MKKEEKRKLQKGLIIVDNEGDLIKLQIKFSSEAKIKNADIPDICKKHASLCKKCISRYKYCIIWDKSSEFDLYIFKYALITPLIKDQITLCVICFEIWIFVLITSIIWILRFLLRVILLFIFSILRFYNNFKEKPREKKEKKT